MKCHCHTSSDSRASSSVKKLPCWQRKIAQTYKPSFFLMVAGVGQKLVAAVAQIHDLEDGREVLVVSQPYPLDKILVYEDLKVSIDFLLGVSLFCESMRKLAAGIFSVASRRERISSGSNFMGGGWCLFSADYYLIRQKKD